jgi:hypothetical protein
VKDDLEQPLGEFRAAVRQWSAESEARPVDRRGAWALRYRLAAAAALVFALVAIPVYEKVQHDRQHAAELFRQDEVLMQQIDADLARSVPATFEPLTQLVTYPNQHE